MRVLLFGATGMVGQGVLRACLADPGVREVVAVSRRPCGRSDAKLREILHADFADLTPIAPQLADVDACFYCLGVSALGLGEAAYRRVTYDYALAAAQALLPQAANLVFVYVSGAGTDAHGRAMWARVKGETENALRALPFRRAVMVRPGYIQPRDGAVSRTGWYRAIYAVMGPAYPLLARLLPNHVTDTAQLGVAMLAAARHREAVPPVLENRDINWLAAI